MWRWENPQSPGVKQVRPLEKSNQEEDWKTHFRLDKGIEKHTFVWTRGLVVKAWVLKSHDLGSNLDSDIFYLADLGKDLGISLLSPFFHVEVQ